MAGKGPRIPYTHIQNDYMETFLRSIREEYPTDQLVPALIVKAIEDGKYKISVYRYISYKDKELVAQGSGPTFIEAFDKVIKDWKTLITSKPITATQQLLNFK